MTRDASVSNRDFGLDTRAMGDFAEYLIDDSWTETIDKDLLAMNEGKIGRPFSFTDKAIEWAMRLKHALGKSYRFIRGLLNYFLKKHGLPGISLTQIFVRCRKISAVGSADGRILASGSCNVDVSEAPISVAVDSTGMSLNKYGGWLAYHWNKKPVTGWIKLHAAVDPDTNRILAYAVTDERYGDVNILGPLVEDVISAGHNVNKILADAAYDKKSYWSEYTAKKMDVVINIKSSQLEKNCPRIIWISVRTGACPERRK